MTKLTQYTRNFQHINLSHVPEVGGKNASLGELHQNLSSTGVNIPPGFATTAEAYWDFLDANQLRAPLTGILDSLDRENYENLAEVGEQARALILAAQIPDTLAEAIKTAYHELHQQFSHHIQVAVRSSATAEDLPHASFAGQQETYLNIVGEKALLNACLHCYASLFTNRAIKYREDQGFEHMKVALSIGVQQMVRSDKGCSGVAFTVEPDTGFNNVMVISGVWGLGENIVQGTVDPDEFTVFKPALRNNKKSIISKKLGAKQLTMVYSDIPNSIQEATLNTSTSAEKRAQYVLNEEEIKQLSGWLLNIEAHYEKPMDVEWAKDGITNELYIVQARPETVHSNRDSHIIKRYHLKEKSPVLTTGSGLGGNIATGRARILQSPKEVNQLQQGEILITDTTSPDWDTVLKKAAAIVTNKGGRTSHAAIVARELGTVAVVGCGDATDKIKNGQQITVSCAESNVGVVYDGRLEWEEESIDTKQIQLPKTKIMLILGDPEKAYQHAFLPNNGIGLMRLEFIISNAVQIHPMALVKYTELEDKEAALQIEKLTAGYGNRTDYFVDKLSQAVATIAAAFHPKPVIVRMSDFKSNEYANLIGGKQFEPAEENPMLGFRGASRYYAPSYREGFQLECEAMKVVRNEMGLTNVKLMIPFCRTVEEGKKVVEQMASYGLKRGDNGLEIYTMVEIPSNVILADQFAEVFDGFSIGSNDLTQLGLGIDRDNAFISELFDENNEAIKRLIAMVIKTAKEKGVNIGLCGQAPSDFPEFAQFLVKQGIDTISFNQDALIQGITNVYEAEKSLKSNRKEFVA